MASVVLITTDRLTAVVEAMVVAVLFLGVCLCAPIPSSSQNLPGDLVVTLIPATSLRSPFHKSSLLVEHPEDDYDYDDYIAYNHHEDYNVVMDLGRLRSEYVMELYLGTPPVLVSGIFDTGSTLTWFQCRPCVSCISEGSFFAPGHSRSYISIGCSDRSCSTYNKTLGMHCNILRNDCFYTISYGDGSYSKGELGADLVSLPLHDGHKYAIQEMTFGCGYNNTSDDFGTTGIIGMAFHDYAFYRFIPGPKRFSFCFSEDTSIVRFSYSANMSGPKTPIIRSGFPQFHVNVEQITVDGEPLDIPSEYLVTSSKSTGFFIDSGTVNTMLAQGLFDILKAHLEKLLGQAIWYRSFPICYRGDLDDPPEIVFEFTGNVSFVPKTRYSWARYKSANLTCLTFWRGRTQRKFSIIGNRQLHDVNVGHDLEQYVISIQSTDCSNL